MSSASVVSSGPSPLTTLFTPPEGCLDNIYAAPFNGITFFGLGTPCGSLNDSCYPPQVTQAAPASLSDLQPFVYSPGISCPSGYTTAATTDLTPKVTAAACCPSGLVPNGIVCEGFPESPFTATGCDFTSTYSDSASTFTASAALIILAWESSDLAQTITSAPASTQTQSSASSITASNTGPKWLPIQSIASTGATGQTPTSSPTASTSKSGSVSQDSFRPRKGWQLLLLCGSAAAATLLS